MIGSEKDASIKNSCGSEAELLNFLEHMRLA
jgi:hypothetical protein